MAETDGNRLPLLMMEAIQSISRNGTVAFSPVDVMQKVASSIGVVEASDDSLKRAILSHFDDLLRAGIVGLGDPSKVVRTAVFSSSDVAWPNGVAHLTPRGETALKEASRDPINQAGYLHYLEQDSPLDVITRGYVTEALDAYRACCYKATAVMIGAAVENLVLQLRDALVHSLTTAGKQVSSGLKAWQAKTVVDAIHVQVLPDLKADYKKTGDDARRKLHEDAAARLLSIAAEFRRLRNDAGHPASLDPVDAADVHANLLLFPHTANMLRRLRDWVVKYY
jgi:hypothetical protein